MPDLVFAAPKATHAALVTELFPGRGADLALFVDGGNEIVSVLPASIRKVVIARKLEAHPTQQAL